MTLKISPDEVIFPQQGFTSTDGPSRVLLNSDGRAISVLESGTLTSTFQGAYNVNFGMPPYAVKIKFSQTYDFKPAFNIFLTSTNYEQNAVYYPPNVTFSQPSYSQVRLPFFPVTVTESELVVAPSATITPVASTTLVRSFNATLYWSIFDMPWDGQF